MFGVDLDRMNLSLPSPTSQSTGEKEVHYRAADFTLKCSKH